MHHLFFQQSTSVPVLCIRRMANAICTHFMYVIVCVCCLCLCLYVIHMSSKYESIHFLNVCARSGCHHVIYILLTHIAHRSEQCKHNNHRMTNDIKEKNFAFCSCNAIKAHTILWMWYDDGITRQK